jgi:hypothetical protein
MNNAGIGYNAQIHLPRKYKVAMDVLINQGKCIFHECKVQISLHSFTSCGHLFCADGFIKLKFLCQK